MNHLRRLRALRRQMKQRGIEGLLVSHRPDVLYLCGFTGSSALLAITASRAAMFTDGRYIAQAAQETSGARVVIAAKSARDECCHWLAESGIKHCAFDPQTTTVAQVGQYRKALPPGHRGFFQPLAEPLAGTLRQVKDPDELLLMKRAARLGVSPRSSPESPKLPSPRFWSTTPGCGGLRACPLRPSLPGAFGRPSRTAAPHRVAYRVKAS
jgi:Xaa-Pro aminopeptidase